MPVEATSATAGMVNGVFVLRFPQDKAMNAFVKTCPGIQFDWKEWSWKVRLTPEVVQWVAKNAAWFRTHEFSFDSTSRTILRNTIQGRKLNPRIHRRHFRGPHIPVSSKVVR